MPPSSRAQEIRYFLHRVVRASIYHDTYARLSSPFSPFEHRQKNHQPPFIFYANEQQKYRVSLAGVYSLFNPDTVPSSQISFDVLVFRSNIVRCPQTIETDVFTKHCTLLARVSTAESVIYPTKCSRISMCESNQRVP